MTGLRDVVQLLTWQLILCLAIVAGSVAASLGTISSRCRRGRTAGGSPRVMHAAAASVGSCGASATTWRSRWSRVHPAWLLASRAAAVVALAAVLLWDAVTYDLTIMVYYTEWTFLLEIVYFVIATLFSAYGCFVYSRHHHQHFTMLPAECDGSVLCTCSSHVEINHGVEKVGAGLYQLGLFMQILYQICGGAVVLTDVVFWALIVPFMYSAHFTLNAVMGCMHSFNLVFLLAETALNSLEFPWFRMTYFVLWTCSYVIIQWVAHICGLAWWPYPFLNPEAPWAPLWYFSIALLHLPCYAVYWSINVMAKNNFTDPPPRINSCVITLE
ncbi:hypothetical protein GUJ93_ZPchr0008g13358 [Zizania palustris]|uniref:Uncharacterized protein n=1 Tax=Zizania palustris TaxID=103762 RepID=A0A8J5RFQ9_ZIZPA|nr:hypothetical protein GUJ93_ZPchr0008g13358 [Zizania palustris]